jgi:Macrocin-O-methyltransferase (TylF)
MFSRFDWSVPSGSRIARIPQVVQPAALLLRNLKNWIRPRLETDHHRADGMATHHNVEFMREQRFQKAYTRAVEASGWDYGIPFRVHQALWCSRQAQKVNGDFVELGTGRGFIMSAVLADFPNWETAQRSVHLFDTFKSALVDSQGKQSGPVSPYYAISAENVVANFSEWTRVKIHQGNIFDTLSKVKIERISFLHIDMNCPEPETYGLRTLWGRIPRGGVVLLDDYAYAGYESQYKAMNDLSREIGFDILTTATGQGIIIK